jgi:hypothetical protein
MGTGFEFEDEELHSSTTYVMGGIDKTKKRAVDESLDVEDDQKHILYSGSIKTGSDGNDADGPQRDWITKTVEYTVSDAQSMHDHHPKD